LSGTKTFHLYKKNNVTGVLELFKDITPISNVDAVNADTKWKVSGSCNIIARDNVILTYNNTDHP
jgi:hypothetical protein